MIINIFIKNSKNIDPTNMYNEKKADIRMDSLLQFKPFWTNVEMFKQDFKIRLRLIGVFEEDETRWIQRSPKKN